MNIIENIKSAITSIFANKMRTFLTTIGIIIGVSSVILITSIGDGFEKSISKSFETLSSTAVQVFPWEVGSSINTKDIENIKEHQNVRAVTGYNSSRVSIRLKNPNEEKVYQLSAIDPVFSTIEKNLFDFKYGRMFSEKESTTKSKIAVIDEKIAKEVFGRTDVVDEYINLYINGLDYNFKIVGVLKSGKDIFSFSTVYIPSTTYIEISNRDSFDILYVDLKNTENIKTSQREIVRILASNHRVKDQDYFIVSNMEQIDAVKKIIKTFTIFISFVAGISLLVGGIGVMNIMLVTVTERTREIGIRKSIGATNKVIKLQFLIEAMFLCSLGGLLGILVGYLSGNIVGAFLVNLEVSGITIGKPIFSLPIALGAMIVSVLVGVIFGVYPAAKAAELDPIEALRYE